MNLKFWINRSINGLIGATGVHLVYRKKEWLSVSENAFLINSALTLIVVVALEVINNKIYLHMKKGDY